MDKIKSMAVESEKAFVTVTFALISIMKVIEVLNYVTSLELLWRKALIQTNLSKTGEA